MVCILKKVKYENQIFLKAKGFDFFRQKIKKKWIFC